MDQPSIAAPASPRSLLAIVLAMIASVLLYALLFGWVLHKPMTVGTIRDYFTIKLARAAEAPSPKLVFMGGSNVRVGLSCEVAERETGVPCVNAGFIADVGIDLMAQKFEPLLNAGDVVYIPLAYEQYLWDRVFVETQRDAAYLFSYDKQTLLQMPGSRQLHALFFYNLPYLASAAAENLLVTVGVRRKAGGSRMFGAHNLNRWGDDTGHTRERGRDYTAMIARAVARAPDAERFEPERYYYTQSLQDFLARMHARGVTVVGGLPQTADEFVIPDAVIARIRALYELQGQRFVELPNRSQYPRSCFYDSLYHLNEECQRQHTIDLLPTLSAYLSPVSVND